VIDLALIAVALFSFYRGWRSGLLKSAFSLLGFIGGGLLGLIAGTKYLDGVSNIVGKFSLFILFISIGSTIGEWVLTRIGQLVHDKVMFAPVKWLDSILGAAFEILKAAIVIYLIFTLIIAAHWATPSKYINQSKLFSKAKVVVPSVIKDATAKVKF
jgi:uncharacterized membrane protein required for colicin V production